MNFSDPEHLTRLFAYMRMNNRAAILEAERGLLKEEIRTMELERDAAVASTVATFEPELTERRKRLEEVEGKIAGEQIGLFKVVTLAPNFAEATKVTVKDSPFNAAMNYAAKYPASQEGIGAVISCSTNNEPGNNTGAYFNTPKNAQVVTRDGQTFFVFKSAGYKAIAERLGFPYRSMGDGLKRYLLTPEEYNDVFAEHERAAKYRKEMKEFKL